MYRWELTERITHWGAIAVIRAPSAEQAVEVARAVAAGGIRVIEVALTTPDGPQAIRSLAAEAWPGGGDGALIGAGTVLDAESAVACVRAGARFLVSPSLVPDVVRVGHRYGVPVMAGAATPTEVLTALELGADLVKVFPAEILGPQFIKAVRAALPQAPLVPTGGVRVENVGEWLTAGAVAVGLGGGLTRGTPVEIAAKARALQAAITEFRAATAG